MRRFLLVIVSYSLLFAVFAGSLYLSHENDRTTYIDGHLAVLESRIDTTLVNMGIFSRFVFESSIDRPEVTALVSTAWSGNAEDVARNREALYQFMLPVYNKLLAYDYRQLHFHFPDCVSFLRMHSPEDFGDNLYSIRPTVRLANERLEPVAGFEEGRIFNGYRFVYPLFNEGVHCGSVEVSFSMGSFITILAGEQNSTTVLASERNSTIVFAIKRSVVESTVFAQKLDNYIPSPFSDEYLLDSHLQNPPGDARLQTLLRERIQDKLKEGEDFGLVLPFNGIDRLMLFKAVRNLNRDTVGYLITASDDTGYALLRTGYRLALIIAALALGVATILTERLLVERARLQAMASTDQLTGLANRHRFIEVAKNELLRSARHGLPVSMALFDIDRFKSFNDSFGHNEGDRVLKGVARATATAIRETDTLGRWGGEEFVVVLPFCGKASALLVAEKLRLAVCESSISPKRQVTISVGVAEFDGKESLESLISRADSAMYQAKGKGRNCVAGHEPEDLPSVER
jgi:diguanylate cyclase (GGDEF)-like protein